MIDGFIGNWPESESFLQSEANLYSAYAGIYVKDAERAQRLTSKEMDYAVRAACARDDDWCEVRTLPISDLEALLAKTNKRDVPVLYVPGSTWVSYIQQHSGDLNARAKLGHVTALMQRVVELDEEYEFGQADRKSTRLNA